MCLIYKCKIVFVACNEIAFCFIYIVGSLGTVAQGDDSVSTQAKVTLSLHVCIKCVSFEENEFALVAIKCQIVFVSVTRRYRSDVVHSLPYSWLVLT